MELRSERLLLRRPLASDLEAMFAIMSDPQAMRYWSTLPHADREVTRRWLDKMLERTANGGEDFIMVLDGKAIGTVGAGRLPDFGFMLRRDCWGRGLATEASRAFIAYAFADTAATHLDADVDPRNAASLSVLGKLGFIETGRARNTFLLGDEWCHSVYLRLTRPEAS
ncbi:GNAT family N-acetyltransferase [Devosia sp. A8/3-2]|nr:GNAT family N-acetyltransferase [Devosia sp. A8/3-2]